MKQTGIRWLYSELPRLQEHGVVSEVTAERLREFYGPVPERSSPIRVVVTLLSVLGAGLIGLGVILLLAHNWMALSRPVRAVLSFMPLFMGQLLVGWTLLRRQGSMAWSEGSGIFLAASIGACIALISQTYYMGGNLETFLLTWLVLGFPLIYLLRSVSVLILYQVGLLCWLGYVQDRGYDMLLYWPLLGLMLPSLYHHCRDNLHSGKTQLLGWVFSIHGAIAIGFLLEDCPTRLGILIYISYFAALALLSMHLFSEGGYIHPFALIGKAGVVIMALVLTFEDVWQEVGRSHYGWTTSFYAFQNYFLALGMLGVVTVVSIRLFRNNEAYKLIWSVFPLWAIICCFNMPYGIAMVGFNLLLLIAGAYIMWCGIRQRQLGTVNGGMAILTLLFISRFFDVDLSFTLRGIVFILLGCGFLTTNLWIGRKLAKKEGAES